MKILHINEANFKEEVLHSEVPVLVDFWAPWCGPCKMIAPHLEELAREFDSRIKIVKINIDDSSKIATSYGIMSIPTLIFFKKGKIMDQVVGALSRLDLKRKIEENLQ